MQNPLQGRRVDVEHDGDGKPIFPILERPGDYCGPLVGWTGDKPSIFFLKPNARDDDAPRRARGVQHVLIAPGYHSCEEHEDGTITISPSIGDTIRGGSGDSDGWHGFLRRGVWSLA